MDNAKRTGSKPRKKTQDPTLTKGFSHRPVHVVLGLVLMEAGLCKLSESAFETQDWSTISMLMMLFFGAEFLGGTAMVFALAPALAHRCAVAAFTGFAISNLGHVLTGVCSCGCLGGGPSINPWAVFLFDLAAIIALLTCRRPHDLGPGDSMNPLRSPALLAIAIIIVLAGLRQGAMVRLEGRATWRGHPMSDRELVFARESERFVTRTDGEGRFRLPLVRPGTYVVTTDWRPSSKDLKRKHSIQWIEASSCSDPFKNIDFADQK